jgi:hypothetical protein
MICSISSGSRGDVLCHPRFEPARQARNAVGTRQTKALGHAPTGRLGVAATKPGGNGPGEMRIVKT